ncbi:hypothetical protein ACGFY9_15035 [Streptomyces sp. NPDC048504]|uniref:hypothetical protein n=1 Tax=Streptomyces sp. NPDC048504 TaxID=3365559 RepID=UPI0037229284
MRTAVRDTVHTGGEVDVSSGSSSGPLAARAVGAINLDLAVLSAGSRDLAHRITSFSMDKVLLKHAVMEATGSVALLADSTKWGTVERSNVTKLDRLDTVVTEEGLPSAVADRIAEEGPAVLRTG